MATFNVSTQSELTSALGNAVGGDTILCAPGYYGALEITDKAFSTHVKIQSATEERARVGVLWIKNSSYIHVDNIHVDNPGEGSASSKVVGVQNASHHILVSNCEVNGLVSNTTNYVDFQGHYGMYSDHESHDVRFENNYIHDVKNGVVCMGTDNIEVVGNTLDRMGNDSMKFAGNNGVLIENNIGARTIYRAPEAHLDFIQFQGAAQNITIRGNVYLAGNEIGVQAIFMGDGAYDNVLVEQNILYTGMIHGITIYEGTNQTIKNNTVLSMPGSYHKATLIMAGNASTEGNLVSATEYDGRVEGGNLYVQRYNPDQPHYYDDYFANARAGLGITLEDLAIIEGTIAENYGATERYAELMNGNTTIPNPDPVPEPEPDPEPVPIPDEDIIIITEQGMPFAMLGTKSFSTAADVIEQPHNDNFLISSGTIKLTFTANDVTGSHGLLSKDAAGDGHHFATYIKDGSLYARFQDGVTSETIQKTGIQPNIEYKLHVDFGVGEANAWLDGSLIGTVPTNMNWTENYEYLQVGANGWASPAGGREYKDVFSGTISNVVIVEGIKTPEEMAEILKNITDANTTPEPTPDPEPVKSTDINIMFDPNWIL